ncbi:hypothetical protein Trydic_g9844 [Trypoxylus dichotomus]
MYVCEINITMESKLVKKDKITQCHRCHLYGHGQRKCHAAAVCVKCTGPHQTAGCTKPRYTPPKCTLCQGTHTANYKACPKSPYAKKRDVPVQPPTTAKVAKVTGNLPKKAPEAMETDTPLLPTSAMKPSYAAAVKKNAAKKTKTSKKEAKKSVKSQPNHLWQS